MNNDSRIGEGITPGIPQPTSKKTRAGEKQLPSANSPAAQRSQPGMSARPLPKTPQPVLHKALDMARFDTPRETIQHWNKLNLEATIGDLSTDTQQENLQKLESSIQIFTVEGKYPELLDDPTIKSAILRVDTFLKGKAEQNEQMKARVEQQLGHSPYLKTAITLSRGSQQTQIVITPQEFIRPKKSSKANELPPSVSAETPKSSPPNYAPLRPERSPPTAPVRHTATQPSSHPQRTVRTPLFNKSSPAAPKSTSTTQPPSRPQSPTPSTPPLPATTQTSRQSHQPIVFNKPTNPTLASFTLSTEKRQEAQREITTAVKNAKLPPMLARKVEQLMLIDYELSKLTEHAESLAPKSREQKMERAAFMASVETQADKLKAQKERLKLSLTAEDKKFIEAAAKGNKVPENGTETQRLFHSALKELQSKKRTQFKDTVNIQVGNKTSVSAALIDEGKERPTYGALVQRSPEQKSVNKILAEQGVTTTSRTTPYKQEVKTLALSLYNPIYEKLVETYDQKDAEALAMEIATWANEELEAMLLEKGPFKDIESLEQGIKSHLQNVSAHKEKIDLETFLALVDKNEPNLVNAPGTQKLWDEYSSGKWTSGEREITLMQFAKTEREALKDGLRTVLEMPNTKELLRKMIAPSQGRAG